MGAKAGDPKQAGLDGSSARDGAAARVVMEGEAVAAKGVRVAGEAVPAEEIMAAGDVATAGDGAAAAEAGAR